MNEWISVPQSSDADLIEPDQTAWHSLEDDQDVQPCSLSPIIHAEKTALDYSTPPRLSADLGVLKENAWTI